MIIRCQMFIIDRTRHWRCAVNASNQNSLFQFSKKIDNIDVAKRL